MICLRTLASVSPVYGFILLFGTTWSGFAMNWSSVASSHVRPLFFRLSE